MLKFKVYGNSCLGNHKFEGTYISPNMITAINELKCDGYYVTKIEELEEVHEGICGEKDIQII